MNDQLWLPFIDWDRPTQPGGPEYERDLFCFAPLPEPDDSPAYQRFGFVVKDVPRGLATALRWMHWTRQ